MAEFSPFARFIAFVSEGVVAIRHSGERLASACRWAWALPIPEAKPQGKIPTLKMPTAKGWEGEHKPTVAAGLQVNAFARGLVHPRTGRQLWIGDVLVRIDGRSGKSTHLVRPCHVGHDAAGARFRRQPQPSDAAARCRRRRGGRGKSRLYRECAAALRHRACRGDALCRSQRRASGLSLRGGRDQHRAGATSNSSGAGAHWTRKIRLPARMAPGFTWPWGR